MYVAAGLFRDALAAQGAVEELRGNGSPPHAVRVIARDPERAYEATPEAGTEVPLGALGGTRVGGAVGTVTGSLAEAGALSIEVEAAAFEVALAAGPSTGILDVVSPVVATGAGLGALAAGGLLGAHVGWASVEEVARIYPRRVRDGDLIVLVGVPSRQQARTAVRILRRHAAEHPLSGLAPDATQLTGVAG
jgi:hypothetical protein